MSVISVFYNFFKNISFSSAENFIFSERVSGSFQKHLVGDERDEFAVSRFFTRKISLNAEKVVDISYSSPCPGNFDGVADGSFHFARRGAISFAYHRVEFFGYVVYKTMIPRTVRLSEAPSYGQPIIYYDKRSKGADVYRNLAEEVIARGK